jgi:hypothetical protein
MQFSEYSPGQIATTSQVVGAPGTAYSIDGEPLGTSSFHADVDEYGALLESQQVVTLENGHVLAAEPVYYPMFEYQPTG